jgi:hypothetical protein
VKKPDRKLVVATLGLLAGAAFAAALGPLPAAAPCCRQTVEDKDFAEVLMPGASASMLRVSDKKLNPTGD